MRLEVESAYLSHGSWGSYPDFKIICCRCSTSTTCAAHATSNKICAIIISSPTTSAQSIIISRIIPCTVIALCVGIAIIGIDTRLGSSVRVFIIIKKVVKVTEGWVVGCECGSYARGRHIGIGKSSTTACAAKCTSNKI